MIRMLSLVTHLAKEDRKTTWNPFGMINLNLKRRASLPAQSFEERGPQLHLTVPECEGGPASSPTAGGSSSPDHSADSTPSPSRKVGRVRKSLPEARLAVPAGPHGDGVRRKSYDLAADGGKSNRLGLLLNRLNPLQPTAMKKTEAAKAAAANSASTTPTNSTTTVASSASTSSRVFRKALSRSPNLQRKPDNGSKSEGGSGAAVPPAVSGLVSGVNRAFAGSGTLHTPGVEEAVASPVAFSIEDLDTVDGNSGRENGSETQTTTAHSDEGSVEGHLSDSSDRAKTVAAIEHLKLKIMKTRDLIRQEQDQKESNVNEYLHLAASADKQQNQRIKTVFEKRNQKSAQSINHLQKKLEQYQKRLADIEMHGIPGHKQAKEVLRDVGQGLNTIVSKPREFAHLIKNRFGSADNIAQMKMDEGVGDSMGHPPARVGNTLPASFKYTSDDDNSSELSGSGCGGLQGSPQFLAQTQAQALSAHQVMAAEMGPLREDVAFVKDSSHRLEESMGRLLEEFDSYKSATQGELSMLRSLLDEEKFKVERLEEQINDLTELHQNEMANCKQDMASMEEKIEYRLDERTTDLNDLVDNCQTRIHRLEQQQQQQQLLSMEMVENVTFRTILTKLINVVLALLAVVLVFVSTAANLLSPFITSRMRILWTGGLVLVISILYAYSSTVAATISYLWDWISQLLSFR